MIRDPSDGSVREKHTGPVCKGCGVEFYYDFIPERHDGSGYCLDCFDDRPKPMPSPDTGIRQPARTDAQERLERSREWLKDYHASKHGGKSDDLVRRDNESELPS